MISGRTRTAEQRAAGVETREDTGMGTVAVAETEETAGTERRAVAGIWLETRNLLLPGTAGSERPSGMPGS